MGDHQNEKGSSSEGFSPCGHRTSLKESDNDVQDGNSCYGKPEMFPEFTPFSLAAAMSDINIDDCIRHSEKMLQFFRSLKNMGCNNLPADENISRTSHVLEDDGTNPYFRQYQTLTPNQSLIAAYTKTFKYLASKFYGKNNQVFRDMAKECIELMESVLDEGSTTDSDEDDTTKNNSVRDEISPSGNISRSTEENDRKFQSNSPYKANLGSGGQKESKQELHDKRGKSLPADGEAFAPPQRYPVTHNKRNLANEMPRFVNENCNRSPGIGALISPDNLAFESTDSLESDGVTKKVNNSQRKKSTQLSHERLHPPFVPLRGKSPQHQAFPRSVKGRQHTLTPIRFNFPNRQRCLIPFQVGSKKHKIIRSLSANRQCIPDVHQAWLPNHQFFQSPAVNSQLLELKPIYPAYNVTPVPPQLPSTYNASATRHHIPTYSSMLSDTEIHYHLLVPPMCPVLDHSNGGGPVFNGVVTSTTTTL